MPWARVIDTCALCPQVPAVCNPDPAYTPTVAIEHQQRITPTSELTQEQLDLASGTWVDPSTPVIMFARKRTVSKEEAEGPDARDLLMDLLESLKAVGVGDDVSAWDSTLRPLAAQVAHNALAP